MYLLNILLYGSLPQIGKEGFYDEKNAERQRGFA